jgi:glycosyltransferase involved in cell wall biosynthesis
MTPAPRRPPGDPLISVVICTRNRAVLLAGAIDSVVRQNFPPHEYELVVVDNASSDHTPDVVRRWAGVAPVRHVVEEKIGLCIARNTGWRAARGDVVAFLDDDAIALPGWLDAVKNGFETTGRTPGVIGGPVEPLWQSNRPTWLSDQIAGALTIVHWGDAAKDIEDIRREWLVGANMALPRRLLHDVGGFHPWLDRAGTNLLSSGDVFLQRELMRRGYRCRYLPAMAVRHLVPEARLTKRWFLRRFYWQGVSDAVMHLIEAMPSKGRRLSLAMARSAALLSSRRKLASLVLSVGQADAFTTKCLTLIDLGFIAGLLGAARR